MSKQKLTNKNLTTILIIPSRDIYYNFNDNKNNIKKQPIKNNNSNDDYNRCINKKYNIIKIPKSVHENKIISILVYLHNKPTKNNNIKFSHQSSTKCTDIVKERKMSVLV